jgi:hypothetical protein
MMLEQALRLIAGFFVLLSVLLGYYVSPYFFLFTGFVALNLMQSAFTNWCPVMVVLRGRRCRAGRNVKGGGNAETVDSRGQAALRGCADRGVVDGGCGKRRGGVCSAESACQSE